MGCPLKIWQTTQTTLGKEVRKKVLKGSVKGQLLSTKGRGCGESWTCERPGYPTFHSHPGQANTPHRTGKQRLNSVSSHLVKEHRAW